MPCPLGGVGRDMHLRGAEAQALLDEKLTRVLVDESGWETIHWHPGQGTLWLLTYPQSEMHGGGPPDLREVSPEAVFQAGSQSVQWQCADLDALVSYLIDSWCERRATQPLGRVLSSWPHNGLTDGYAELRDALANARALREPAITEVDGELLGLALNAIDRRLHSR